MRRAGWLIVTAVAIIAAVAATTATRPPATGSQRAYELKEATLCPVCDGQSVLESNAPVAAAMRRQIDAWVDEGRSDTDIRSDLAAAYGDDVNALPPGQGIGTLVWALPVAAFALGAVGLWLAMRRWRDRADDDVESDGHGVEASAPHDAARPQARTRHSRRRMRLASVATVGALLAVGLGAGVLVARSAGLRLPGETISGDIDRSARSLLVDAQRQFAANQLGEARATLNEVFRLDGDLRGGRMLSARVYLRACETSSQSGESSSAAGGAALIDASAECDIVAALTELDHVLDADPRDSEALALRGWILVRIPDAELISAGVAALDAAVALDPADFDPWVFRGYAARYVQGDLEAAIDFYRTALGRNPPPAMAAGLETAISEMEAELGQASRQ